MTEPRPHPSGGQVAAVGTRITGVLGESTPRVQLIDTTGIGEPVDLAPDWDGATRVPRWSPDGHRLAFTTERVQSGIGQIAWWEHGDDGALVDGPQLPGTVEHLDWSPDSRHLIAVVAGCGAERAGAMTSGRVPFRQDRQPSATDPIVRRFGLAENPHDEWRRLWIVDTNERTAHCITDHGPCVWEAAWAGTGHIVAVVSDRPEEDAWYSSHLALLNAAAPGDSASSRSLVTSERQLGVPAGSPNGATVACIEAPCSDRTLVAGRLVIVGVANGEIRRVGRDTLGLDATHIVWLDDRRLLVSGLVGMASRIVEYDIVSDAVVERHATTAVIGPRQPESWPDDAAALVFASNEWSDPPSVTVIEPHGEARRVWSADIDSSDAGVLERRTWSAPDGWEIDGFVVRPHGDGPFPTVLYPHGGPVALHRPGFVHGMWAAVELLVERGFAVFLPNPRGSAGYGWEFTDAVHGDMGGLDTHDLLSGLDDLVAAGIADPDRLTVMGGSYAGYMTCWLVTQTTRFRAAMASASVTNWISQHFQSNIPQWGARFLPDAHLFPAGGYVERSPVYFAERVTTPTLLDSGAHDRCCPPTNAVEFFEALRRHGVPCELVIYPNDAHNVPVGELHVDYLDRLVSWFERWLS